MKRWPGSTSPEHVIMGYNGGVLRLSPTPLNRETVPGEYCEHLRTCTNIYEHLRTLRCSGGLVLLCHDPLWVRLPTMAMWGLANLCVALHCNERDCQTVRVLCQEIPFEDWQNGSKWIKMDQNGYWHLDMVWYGSHGPDMLRYIMIYSRYI